MPLLVLPLVTLLLAILGVRARGPGAHLVALAAGWDSAEIEPTLKI